MNGSVASALFHEEPPGTFLFGQVFRSAPDLTSAQQDPESGYWHCDIANEDRLTWTERVYDLFGLSAGAPVERDWAVARYSEQSKDVLKRVRTFALNRKFGFILDAAIGPEGARNRWIRILAVPIVADGRVVGLHGLKRSIQNPPTPAACLEG